MSAQKIKLIFDKFIHLLSRNNYILDAVYCENGKIRFAECRTPIKQKTFVVYLPEKYEMPFDQQGADNIRYLNISASKLPPSSMQLQFISDMRGVLLDCDLVAISSENISIYRDNNSTESFNIKTLDEVEDDEVEDDPPFISENDISSEDGIDNLEKDTLNVLKKVDGPNAKLREANDVASSDGESSSEEEKPVELIFEDENGDVVDEVKMYLDTDQAEKSLDSIRKKDAHTLHSRSNSLPADLDEREIEIGIIYILIDIALFFKQISHYEEDIDKCYEQLDENELELRGKNIEKVKTLAQTFSTHMQTKLASLSEHERNIKTQLSRLTMVLVQTESLKNRMTSNTKKYGDDVIKETNRIYDRTKKTIHDMNIEILKIRDEINELLSNYLASLEEMIDM